jgi:tRNA(fMet)-specific endonuclease VapC
VLLLDTNIASDLIRGGAAGLLEQLEAQAVGSVGISAITEAELLYGLARKPAATALAAIVETFLRHVPVHPWDHEAAARYGPLRASLEAAGTPLSTMDGLIAAHALSLGAALVTRDHAFARVPGLKLETWPVPNPRQSRRSRGR